MYVILWSTDCDYLLFVGYNLKVRDGGDNSLIPGSAEDSVYQTGCVSQPTSYSVGARDFFSGVKRPQREAGHSPPASA